MQKNKKEEEEKSKERILKSATKLFACKGYNGVGIREICKDANANICMVSYFWGGKEGLYKGIIENLSDWQMEYIKQFVDVSIEPSDLPKDEQIKLLYEITDNFVEALYGGYISDDLFRFLLRAQQSHNIQLSATAIVYMRKLIAAVFDKDIDDKDIIFKTVFIISQINSPKVLPAFSLDLLKQKSFTQDDKEIIKKNVRLYIDTLIKEGK